MDENKIRGRRELAETIMAAAIEKVEKLGFSMLLSESDNATKRHAVRRHHLLFHRLSFVYTDYDVE